METIIVLALLFALAMAAYAASRMLLIDFAWPGRRQPVKRASFPAIMTPQSHWSRATGIVELSLARATDMAAHQANAARQLEAADYALHILLGELNQVMATTVVSPLARKARPTPATAHMPSAMAA